MRIHYKRTRAHIHSPDPDYEARLIQVAQVHQRAAQSAGQEVLLYSAAGFACGHERAQQCYNGGKCVSNQEG